MISRCGFDSTSTSLLVCSALMNTPNDGMSTGAVERGAVAEVARGRAEQRGARARRRVSAQRLVGFSVLAGLKPPTISDWLAQPNRFAGVPPW